MVNRKWRETFPWKSGQHGISAERERRLSSPFAGFGAFFHLPFSIHYLLSEFLSPVTLFLSLLLLHPSRDVFGGTKRERHYCKHGI